MTSRKRSLYGIAFAVVALIAVARLAASAGTPQSGVEKGAALPAYHPKHVAGPDRNTDACPVCKYPFNPAIQVWVNTDQEANVAAIAQALDEAVKEHADKKLKAFVVFINPFGDPSEAVEARLAKLVEQKGLRNVAVCYLPDAKHPAVAGYGINTDASVKNTVFVYRARKVESKFVNLAGNAAGLAELKAAIKGVL